MAGDGAASLPIQGAKSNMVIQMKISSSAFIQHSPVLLPKHKHAYDFYLIIFFSSINEPTSSVSNDVTVAPYPASPPVC